MVCSPPDDTVLRRELNAASNELESLPEEIGKCQRLSVVKLQNNHLDELPAGIGDCKSLAHVFAGNNRIQVLPDSLGKLTSLATLSLPSNKLKEVPLSLFNCVELTVIDLTSNEDLVMVPEELRTNAPVVKFLCRQFQRECELREAIQLQRCVMLTRSPAVKKDKMDEFTAANDELEHLLKLADDERTELRREIVELRKRNRDLLEREPKYYMKAKLGVKGCASRACVVQ